MCFWVWAFVLLVEPSSLMKRVLVVMVRAMVPVVVPVMVVV